MKVRSNLRPESLTPARMAFIATFVLVVLPIVLGLAFFNQLYAFYLSTLIAPGLEQALGFRGDHAMVQVHESKYETYVLVSVDPKGFLGLAGARTGDVPCGYQHGMESGFLGDLHHSRGQTVELTLCTPPNWTSRTVVLEVPSR